MDRCPACGALEPPDEVTISPEAIEVGARILAKYSGRPLVFYVDRDNTENILIALIEDDYIQLTEKGMDA